MKTVLCLHHSLTFLHVVRLYNEINCTAVAAISVTCLLTSISTSNLPNFVTWLLLSNSQTTSLIWSAHTVSLACCDHPHRSFCQFRRTTWTLLLVVSLLLLRDFGTLFHWTVELLHPLTHLRSVSRHFSLIRHNRTVARASVLWRDINLLIDWLIDIGSSLASASRLPRSRDRRWLHYWYSV